MAGLYFIDYTSIAAAACDQVALSDILNTAVSRNEALGVTGVLVFTGRTFRQHLEGEETAVKAVFASICRDARHDDIQLVASEAVERRMYPMWSMASGEVLRTPAFTDNLARLLELNEKRITPRQLASLKALIADLPADRA